jgi:hypothetical protein
MSYANPHYDPDWKALHERHAGERQRAQEELNRLAESGAMMSDAYKTAQAAFRRHNAACLATVKMRHATVQEFAEWLFGSFPWTARTGRAASRFPRSTSRRCAPSRRPGRS